MFAWTRNFYSELNGIIFQFESKRTRDNHLKKGAKKISAEDYYKTNMNAVKIRDIDTPLSGRPWKMQQELKKIGNRKGQRR